MDRDLNAAINLKQKIGRFLPMSKVRGIHGQEDLMKFLFGIIFTIVIQFTVSIVFTYKFNLAFRTKCGVQSGYVGTSDERFVCVYKEIGYLNTIAGFVLIRPVYDMNNGITFTY
jgi:hypothetical protein